MNYNVIPNYKIQDHIGLWKFFGSDEVSDFITCLENRSPENIRQSKKILLKVLASKVLDCLKKGIMNNELPILKPINFKKLFRGRPEVIASFLPKIFDRLDTIEYTTSSAKNTYQRGLELISRLGIDHSLEKAEDSLILDVIVDQYINVEV